MYVCAVHMHACILYKIKAQICSVLSYVSVYMCTGFYILLVHYLLCLYYTESDCYSNESVQGDLELKANCSNSGSEGQSSLHWNPASLSKELYNDDFSCNFNFDYICYNFSLSHDQVSTII